VSITVASKRVLTQIQNAARGILGGSLNVDDGFNAILVFFGDVE
jgi:hypothetical protein